MIFAAACLLFCGSVIATEYATNNTIVAQEIASEWENCGTRKITKFIGNMKASNSAAIRRDGLIVEAYYGGEWHRCSYSDRSDFDYKFYDGTSNWYFSL